MRKITLAFISFLLSATGTLFAQHAKKYADLTLDEYNSEYAEMKKSDDFSTDARGNITKFKKTLPNLCTIVWEGGTTKGKYTLDVTITSYDGDVYKGVVKAKRYNSVNEGIKFIYSNFKRDEDEEIYSYEGGPITKDVPLEDMWFLEDGIITFADKTKSPIERSRMYREVRVPLKQAGDYYEKTQELDSIDGGKVVWKDKTYYLGLATGGFRVTLEDGVFINSGGWKDKTIIYNNGDVYKGAITFNKNDSIGMPGGESSAFDRANLLKFNKISDIGRPSYGEMTKADGTVVVIKNGEEDEFETIKRTKIAQAKIEEEKAAAKEQAALNQKYGKKYVDAMLTGQIIIGMPEELIQLGIFVEAFLPRFNIMTTSIDYGNGNVCKDLTLVSVSTSRLKNVGYIWFNGGKVSSIVYY